MQCTGPLQFASRSLIICVVFYSEDIRRYKVTVQLRSRRKTSKISSFSPQLLGRGQLNFGRTFSNLAHHFSTCDRPWLSSFQCALMITDQK